MSHRENLSRDCERSLSWVCAKIIPHQVSDLAVACAARVRCNGDPCIIARSRPVRAARGSHINHALAAVAWEKLAGRRDSHGLRINGCFYVQSPVTKNIIGRAAACVTRSRIDVNGAGIKNRLCRGDLAAQRRYGRPEKRHGPCYVGACH